MRIALLAHSVLGERVCEWLIRNYVSDIAVVVCQNKNSIFDFVSNFDVPVRVAKSSQDLSAVIDEFFPLDYGFLVWWPSLIKPDVLGKVSGGFINTHPSMLPHGRGKNYNFWAIVENSPFGVSLHFVDESIDSGDIVAQSEIVYDWEDNGGSLYKKAQEAMFQLFVETYPALREGKINRVAQNLNAGSLHFAMELDPASTIRLDETYKARDLINLLRARTFPPHPACIFEDGGNVYEVSISIKKK